MDFVNWSIAALLMPYARMLVKLLEPETLETFTILPFVCLCVCVCVFFVLFIVVVVVGCWFIFNFIIFISLIKN